MGFFCCCKGTHDTDNFSSLLSCETEGNGAGDIFVYPSLQKLYACELTNTTSPPWMIFEFLSGPLHYSLLY